MIIDSRLQIEQLKILGRDLRRKLHTIEVSKSTPPNQGRKLQTQIRKLREVLHALETLGDEPQEEQRHPRWRRFEAFAKKLQDMVESIKNMKVGHHHQAWTKSFELLHTQNKVDIKRIREVLNWYCANYPKKKRDHHPDYQWLVEAEAGYTFRDKFAKIEGYMKEWRRKHHSSSEDQPAPVIKRGPARTEKEWAAWVKENP
jgi:hypothetical protein